MSKSIQFKYRLKQMMEFEGISQVFLAKYLNVSNNTVNNWCNIKATDHTSIPGDALLSISFLLGRTIEEIHNKKHFSTLKKLAS